MKEFSIDFENLFKNGLRRLNKSDRTKTSFVELLNMEPTEQGLVPYNDIINPFTPTLLHMYNIQFEYPFPQLFIGKGRGILAHRTKVYLVNIDTWDELYELDLYDIDDPTTRATITPGSYWHLVDMGETFFLTNGVDTVFLTGKDAMLGNAEKAYIKHGMPFTCGSYYKGRVVFGGLDYHKFWSDDWKTLWDTWLTKKTDTGLSFERKKEGFDVLMPVGKNWIWWSSIGGGDVQMLFSSSLAEEGYTSSTYSSTKPLIMDILKSNEQGFAQLPFLGDVIGLKELGDYLIAYTLTGIIALRHTPLEIGSTLAQVDIPVLSGVGLLSNGALAGSKDHHVFIDSSGTLWELDSSLKAVPLGYREFLYPMIGQQPTIHFAQNPYNLDGYGEFYISSISKTYKLVKGGLLETGQDLSSACYIEGATIGVCTDYNTKEEGRFKTDTIDFGNPGLKSIRSITVLGAETYFVHRNKAYIALEYRTDQKGDFKSTGWRLANQQGVVFFPVSGIEFRIKVKVKDYRRWSIGRLIVSYQEGDRRFRRSLDVTKA